MTLATLVSWAMPETLLSQFHRVLPPTPVAAGRPHPGAIIQVPGRSWKLERPGSASDRLRPVRRRAGASRGALLGQFQHFQRADAGQSAGHAVTTRGSAVNTPSTSVADLAPAAPSPIASATADVSEPPRPSVVTSPSEPEPAHPLEPGHDRHLARRQHSPACGAGATRSNGGAAERAVGEDARLPAGQRPRGNPHRLQGQRQQRAGDDFARRNEQVHLAAAGVRMQRLGPARSGRRSCRPWLTRRPPPAPAATVAATRRGYRLHGAPPRATERPAIFLHDQWLTLLSQLSRLYLFPAFAVSGNFETGPRLARNGADNKNPPLESRDGNSLHRGTTLVRGALTMPPYECPPLRLLRPLTGARTALRLLPPAAGSGSRSEAHFRRMAPLLSRAALCRSSLLRLLSSSFVSVCGYEMYPLPAGK